MCQNQGSEVDCGHLSLLSPAAGRMFFDQTLFCHLQAIETMYNMLKQRQLVKPIPNGEV